MINKHKIKALLKALYNEKCLRNMSRNEVKHVDPLLEKMHVHCVFCLSKYHICTELCIVFILFMYLSILSPQFLNSVEIFYEQMVFELSTCQP